MRNAPDFYFDDVSQIRMNRWSNGRVALVGDAACAPTLITGQGTSMALVGAYVLAGELASAGGDYRTAFACYEQECRSYMEQNQEIALKAREVRPPDTWEEIERQNAPRDARRAARRAPGGRTTSQLTSHSRSRGLKARFRRALCSSFPIERGRDELPPSDWRLKIARHPK